MLRPVGPCDLNARGVKKRKVKETGTGNASPRCPEPYKGHLASQHTGPLDTHEASSPPLRTVIRWWEGEKYICWIPPPPVLWVNTVCVGHYLPTCMGCGTTWQLGRAPGEARPHTLLHDIPSETSMGGGEIRASMDQVHHKWRPHQSPDSTQGKGSLAALEAEAAAGKDFHEEANLR